MQRAVITIAVGKPVYLRMAINLARSFLLWHRNSDIAFHLVSDLEPVLPADLGRVRTIRVTSDELGAGYASKLHLDRLAPAAQTLFIDADCLCVGELSGVFDQFAGRPVSVVGSSIAQGDWLGVDGIREFPQTSRDVSQICADFNLPCLPKFNGGVYYLEPGEKAAAVYARARMLNPQYDRLGLRRLRGQPNDELLMAIALALEGCEVLPDDGSIMGDLCSCPNVLEVDVLGGRCRLSNPPPPDPLHRSWYPVGEIRPLIVHFVGGFSTDRQYRAEARKLQLVFESGMSEAVAGFTARMPESSDQG